MEATTIDKLFTEVLEEIFSHLSASDLNNCALVCKAWNEVIGSSEVTMMKFEIGFRFDRKGTFIEIGRRGGIKIQSSDQSDRKYQKIEFRILDGSLTQLPSLDRFNMSQVKTLHIGFGEVEDDLDKFLSFHKLGNFYDGGDIIVNFGKVVELLTGMPLLRKLTIRFGLKCSIDTSNAPAADLTKLKELFLEAYDKPINTEYSDAEIDVMAGFIKSNKSLATINIKADLFIQLLRRHDFSGMNLESLDVNHGSEPDKFEMVIENFRKSLISNAHSLTSLSIPSFLISKEVLLVIFNQLRKLTSLEISSFNGEEGPWIQHLSPDEISHNLPLRTFKVYRVRALNVILQRAPELKKLTIERGVDDVFMKEVATSAPRLVELRIDYLDGILTGHERFNELKSLSIDKIDNVYSLASLLVRCPKIEVLEINFIWHWCEKPDSIVDILQQQKTLTHLTFYYWKSAVTRIVFDKLKTNYGNLKKLTLCSNYDESKFVTFDFPENPAEWNASEQEARYTAAFKYQV